MTKRCEDVCEDFEKHWPLEMIYEWKEMKRRWEIDPTQPDPYVVVEKGKLIIHTAPVILTPGPHSLEPQRRKTDACGDRGTRVQIR